MKRTLTAAIIAAFFMSCTAKEADSSDAYSDAALHQAFHDYQIEIVEDSILLYDMNRHVGTFPFGEETDPLARLIMDDNH